jgi:branched-chain amino acid aminotransferase
MIGEFYSKNLNLVKSDNNHFFNFSNKKGVYETLKLRDGIIFFPEEHVNRLLNSIKLTNLNDELNFSNDEILDGIEKLIENNKLSDANLKIFYIGENDSKNLYFMMYDPIFPNPQFYIDGVKIISFHGVRKNSHAKYLNPEISQIIYHKAEESGAYDALLVNGFVTEGTRTNVFFIKDDVVYTPPKERVLEGVTRKHVIDVIKNNGVEFYEKDIMFDSLNNYDSVFLTGTSTLVMPVNSIDNINFEINDLFKFIKNKFDDYLNKYKLINQNG